MDSLREPMGVVERMGCPIRLGRKISQPEKLEIPFSSGMEYSLCCHASQFLSESLCATKLEAHARRWPTFCENICEPFVAPLACQY